VPDVRRYQGASVSRAADPSVAAILAQSKAIRAALVRSGVPECDLDDLQQEAILALWRIADAHITGVLAFTVAWRIGRSWRLRASTRERLNAVPLDSAEGYADPLPRIEARDQLRRALAKVRAYDRVLLAGIAEGASVTDMCKRLHMPRGTADTRLRRIRRRLLK